MSCDPTVVTRTELDSPVSASTAGVSPPTTVPGGTTRGSKPVGTPRVSISSVDHCPVRASSSPVVEALVSSVTRSPVSQ